jgi:hypothetical protein
LVFVQRKIDSSPAEAKKKTERMAEENPPKTVVQDQDINPWSVEGAQGENGEVAAINYDAICK